jgi:hypothetical protein
MEVPVSCVGQDGMQAAPGCATKAGAYFVFTTGSYDFTVNRWLHMPVNVFIAFGACSAWFAERC